MGHKYVKEEDTFSTSANGTVPKPTAQEVSDGKVLGADGTWVLPGGSQSLSGLTDTEITTPSSGQVLKYDGSKWVNANESGGSTHTYSETEQVVGKWVTGKPLYEKTYYYQNTGGLSSGTTQLFNIGSTIKPVALIQAISRHKTSGRVYFLPFSNGNATTSIRHDESGYIDIVIANDSWSNNYEFYITIQYTKSTD